MVEKQNKKSGGETIAGIERSVEILSLFAVKGVKDLGVTEIADQLSLSKAVVHRVLASFKAADFVEQDDKTQRYRLGMRTLQIGMAYIEGLDAVEMARDTLPTLVELTQETATVSVRSGSRRVYVAQSTPSTDIKMVVTIGSAHPLHAGASSKALLAFMPSDFQEMYLEQYKLEPLTDLTLTTANAVREELAQVRDAGYALSLGERQNGAGSVAAPILDHTGQPVASVSVCGPVQRFESEIDHCVETLMKIVPALSRQLGYRA